MGSVAAAFVVEQHGPQHHRFDRGTFRARYATSFGDAFTLAADGWA
jgi:hypothetical protein